MFPATCCYLPCHASRVYPIPARVRGMSTAPSFRETNIVLPAGLTPPEQLFPCLRTVATGDVILFTSDRFTAKAIAWFQRCRWHHIGVVLRYPTGHVTVFHALSDGTNISGVRGSGPMESDLQKVMQSGRYTGFALRRLLDPVREGREVEIVRDFVREMETRRYEASLWTLFKANADFYGDDSSSDSSGSTDTDDEYTDLTEASVFRNSDDLSTVFCSELVAALYKRLGRIQGGQSSAEYVPADFAEGLEARHVRGILGPEEQFRLETPAPRA